MSRAALLLHVFSTFAVGGPQVRFAALAAAFGDRFRHAIVAMDGDLACRERLDATLDIAWPEIAVVKGDTFGNRRRFRGILHALNPATLVTYNWGTIEWAMANFPRLVRHVHAEDGFGPEEQARQLPRRAWARRLTLRRSEIVVPSRTLQRIATGTWHLPRQRVRYLPNGIEPARFAVPPQRWQGNGPVIGTVATLRPEKRLDRLIAAVRLLPHARLLIVGDGPERARLESEAAALGPRVRFAGHVADPAPLLRGLDLFALSSDTEQMPISVLEAMAAGLAVAATDVGDVREMLAQPNASFVVARDAAALAGAMRRLLDDAPARRAIGAANRARAEQAFDYTAMVRAWGEVFGAA